MNGKGRQLWIETDIVVRDRLRNETGEFVGEIVCDEGRPADLSVIPGQAHNVLIEGLSACDERPAGLWSRLRDSWAAFAAEWRAGR